MQGAQKPRIRHVPPYASSTGAEAIELAEMAGLILDPWQCDVLTDALGERADGNWAALEVGLMVSRQNGKGALLEARELAGLYLLGEEIVHTAHQFDTAADHFARVSQRIEDTPALAKRLKKPGGILRGHGNECITLTRDPKTGRTPKLEFRTRTGAGGLGKSVKCLVIDEAMIISEAMLAALIPTLSARPNMQVWYTGSAVDQENPSHEGLHFARIRERGMTGDDPILAYFEWSLDYPDPSKVPPLDEIGEREFAMTNPGWRTRLSPEYIERVEKPIGSRHIAVHRLGVGDWPRTDGLDGAVITPEEWDRGTDPESEITGPVVFALDMVPDRSYTAIAVAGFREDGKPHIEVVEHKRGSAWVVERVKELLERHRGEVVCDAASAISSLLPDMQDADIEVTLLNAHEHAQACGLLYDAVQQGRLRHLGQKSLAEAIRVAVKRDLAGAWAWDRRKAAGDISPLVAATLALWGAQTLQPGETELIDPAAMEQRMREEGKL